jgi:hypothetical protein
MSRNPYKPPGSRVTEARGADEPRPGAIKLALILIVLWTMVECYHQFMRHDDVLRGDMSRADWMFDWIWIVLIAVTGFLIARGEGWARWVLLAFALYDLYELFDALLFMSAFEDGDIGAFIPMHSRVMLWTGPLCSLLANILVFGPGRGWFDRD